MEKLQVLESLQKQRVEPIGLHMLARPFFKFYVKYAGQRI